MSEGFPASIKLKVFGWLLYDAFEGLGDIYVFHVGSSVQGKGWRDIDVVVMLPDDRFIEEYGDIGDFLNSPKWSAHCWAFSALGKEITGLPIDFKIQPIEWANKHHDKHRSALLRRGK